MIYDDHVAQSILEGKKILKKPPELPTQEEVDIFADGLVDTIERKLLSLIDRFDAVEQEHQELKSLITSQSVFHGMAPEWEYFWSLLSELDYAENEYIKLWIKYWLKLYEMATKQTVFASNYDQADLYKNGVTPEQIASAKEVPIETVFGDGELKDLGNRIIACCPFHGEKTPSFTIFLEDNHFYCFGCHVGGDAIDFMMKKQGISLVEAVKELNNHAR